MVVDIYFFCWNFNNDSNFFKAFIRLNFFGIDDILLLKLLHLIHTAYRTLKRINRFWLNIISNIIFCLNINLDFFIIIRKFEFVHWHSEMKINAMKILKRKLGYRIDLWIIHVIRNIRIFVYHLCVLKSGILVYAFLFFQFIPVQELGVLAKNRNKSHSFGLCNWRYTHLWAYYGGIIVILPPTNNGKNTYYTPKSTQ